MRPRAASARDASRESRTTLPPLCTKALAMASPIPIEAPVITATLPASSMLGLYSPRRGKSRCGVAPWGQSMLDEPCCTQCHQALVVQSSSPLGSARPGNGEFVALLPLFPLDVVLLPGAPLPLHIFEPRYKEMIGECRANNTPFGVVRAIEEGIADVGCTGDIVSVTKEYPDGRLDLIAEGRQRFEVLELNRQRSFLQAEVLLVADEPGPPAQEDRARAIR